MSMISEQVDRLRSQAGFLDIIGRMNVARDVREAANTIEALSTKLSKANMERSEKYYNGRWILCSDDNLPEKEVLCYEEGGEMMIGRIIKVKGGTYDAENEREYMFNIVAWQPLPAPYKP